MTAGGCARAGGAFFNNPSEWVTSLANNSRRFDSLANLEPITMVARIQKQRRRTGACQVCNILPKPSHVTTDPSTQKNSDNSCYAGASSKKQEPLRFYSGWCCSDSIRDFLKRQPSPAYCGSSDQHAGRCPRGFTVLGTQASGLVPWLRQFSPLACTHTSYDGREDPHKVPNDTTLNHSWHKGLLFEGVRKHSFATGPHALLTPPPYSLTAHPKVLSPPGKHLVPHSTT